MEKAIYPLKNMRITQGYEEGTHIDSYAIDDAGKNTNIENVYAPFTGTIKKIYTQDANEVWLESENPVEYPDGTIDYMTVLFAHDNDISDLYVGKKIKQNEAFYQEGTAGNATGNHCHIECAKGKYIEPGWQQNEAGYYNIINAKRPEECLWLNNTNVIDNHGYNFMEIPIDIINAPSDEEIIESPSTEAPNTPPEEETDNEAITEEAKLRLIYTCTKTDLYGIYLKEGEQVYLK